MNIKRIKEIQAETAYPDSISVYQALLKVWNECEQEQLHKKNASGHVQNYKDCKVPCKYRDVYRKSILKRG